MPNLLDIEETSAKLPLLCIYGLHPQLTEELIIESAKKFRIILITKKKPSFLEKHPFIYYIAEDHLKLLPKLSETIDYAVIFFQENHPLEFLFEKLRMDKAQTLLVVNTSVATDLSSIAAQAKILSHYRIALLGEVFGRKKVDEPGILSKIIENGIIKGEVRVDGNDLHPVYGISTKDALVGIGRLLFGSFKENCLYHLFYQHPATVLETAHLIGRVEPEIKLHLSETTTQTTEITRRHISDIAKSLSMAESSLDSSFDGFERSIQELFDDRQTLATTWKEKGKKKISSRRSRVLKPIRFTMQSVLLGVLLFLLINFIFLGLGLFSIKSAINHIESGDFNKVAQEAKNANLLLSAIKPSVTLSLEGASFFDRQSKLSETYYLVERAGELSAIAGKTVGSITHADSLTEKSIDSLFADFTFLFQEGQRITLETNNRILQTQLKNTYAKLLSFSTVAPDILGFNGPKNYLLLFQNNNELRPTGGFIGSIGDLTFNKGRIDKIAIQDVYELDGQLRNHVEPPFIVRRYLQPHLYLRDSNFYLDYQQAASTSAFLYNLETGKKPDAVIAIDLQVLEEIMKIAGPVRLASYNVTVDSKTVSQFLQNTIKDGFFPGSTQKRDVLNSLFNQLVERGNSDQKFALALAKLLPQMLEEKHILISFSDDSIQKVFSANDYAGEVKDTRPLNARTINDYLYINEANIGVNKVNSQILREISYKAMIGEGRLTSKATLTITNTSQVDNYRNYITVSTPKGSSLKQITIDGVKQTITPAVTDVKVYEGKNFKKPDGMEVEQYNKDLFTNFAFIADSNKNKKTVIEIEYDNGARKNLSTINTYSLLYIKQPGTSPYKLTATVDYPEDYAPIDTHADSYGKNFLEITEMINKDFTTKIDLQKKK